MGAVVIQQPYRVCWYIVACPCGWCWLMGSLSLQASGVPSSLGQAVEPKADICCHAETGHSYEEDMVMDRKIVSDWRAAGCSSINCTS